MLQHFAFNDMPQMSPMNWILISSILVTMFSMMKIAMNKSIQSKIPTKNLCSTKKISIKW